MDQRIVCCCILGLHSSVRLFLPRNESEKLTSNFLFVLAGSSPIPKNDGPTIPIGRFVEKRVCGIFGLVIAEGVNPLIPRP